MNIRFIFGDVMLDDLSPYELGNIEIVGNMGQASSKNKKPDQSMMLFITATILLDGLRTFIYDNKKTKCEINGIDSSFRVLFEKKGKKIKVTSEDLIEEESIENILKDVYFGVHTFSSKYLPYISESESAKIDLINALKMFRKAFPWIN